MNKKSQNRSSTGQIKGVNRKETLKVIDDALKSRKNTNAKVVFQENLRTKQKNKIELFKKRYYFSPDKFRRIEPLNKEFHLFKNTLEEKNPKQKFGKQK